MNDSYQLDQQRWSKRSESPNSTSLCRLVIIKSPFYAPGSVALLSQTSSVSIGRDRDYGLRIRLKEIEVSKTHSLLFYFEGAYAVTDCGSMHGTFIEREGKEKQRLSESRKASKPFELHNNDLIRIGKTQFHVHLHSSFPCNSCTITRSSSNLISLLPDAPTATTSTQSNYIPSEKTKAEKSSELKATLNLEKQRYLQPHSTIASGSESITPQVKSTQYFDRSKARRAVNPAIEPIRTFSKDSVVVIKEDPFGSDSAGAKLLSKMSSSEPSRLGKMIEVKGAQGKQGIGIAKEVEVAGVKRDWREDGKELQRKRLKDWS